VCLRGRRKYGRIPKATCAARSAMSRLDRFCGERREYGLVLRRRMSSFHSDSSAPALRDLAWLPGEVHLLKLESYGFVHPANFGRRAGAHCQRHLDRCRCTPSTPARAHTYSAARWRVAPERDFTIGRWRSTICSSTRHISPITSLNQALSADPGDSEATRSQDRLRHRGVERAAPNAQWGSLRRSIRRAYNDVSIVSKAGARRVHGKSRLVRI